MTTIRSAGFLIVSDTQPPKFLVLQHANHKSWSPPKGHVEGDETDLQCAQREFHEETGVKIDQLHILSTSQPLVRRSLFIKIVRLPNMRPGEDSRLQNISQLNCLRAPRSHCQVNTATIGTLCDICSIKTQVGDC